MKIIFTGQLFALPNKKPQNGVTYSGFVRLADLVSAHKIHGKELYEGNVRGQLASTHSQILKNPTCKSILETLEEIHSGKLEPTTFFNGSQGCLIMCDSLSISSGTYIAEIKHDYQGIGNGQQTINTSYFFSNRQEISPNILIPIKIMVGYSKKDFQSACVRNNTSSKVSQKSVISNDWSNIAKQLNKIGITLVYKVDAVKTKTKGRIINLHEKNYYNILNSYFNETPWITGNQVINEFRVDSVTIDDLLKLDNFKIELVKWFNANLHNCDTTLFDYGRIGCLHNLIVLAFKKYYDNSISNADFIELCFDKSIYSAIKREGKRVEHTYFLNRTNIENLLDNIESKLTIYKMKQKQLKTGIAYI
jgi:hypothetical protein